MLRRMFATTVILSLATPPVAFADESSVGATADDARARLSIDTEKLGKEADRTRRALEPAVEAALRDAGVVLDQSSTTELRVVIAHMDADSPHDYLFRFDIVHDDAIEPNPPVFDCLSCVTSDLSDRIVQELPVTYPSLRETGSEDSTASTDPVEAVTAPPDVGAGEAPPDRPRAPLGGLGKSGIALLAAGLVGTGVGIGLAARGEQIDGGDQFDRVDFRPAGFATLGVSAALLVTGAVLLGLDRHRAKRTATLTPITGPGLVGFTLTGRF